MQCSVTPQHEDPLFFDREGLAVVASPAVVGEGLHWFREHRVIAEVGVWPYAEALPQGILDQDQVGLLMRALSFAQGGSAPAHLVSALLDDAANFVAPLAG